MPGASAPSVDAPSEGTVDLTAALLGGAPGSTRQRIGVAALRALRTLLQGIAGAFPAAGAGTAILSSTYWETFGYSVLAAVIVAFVSFLQNVASILPSDPTQKPA